VDWTWWACKMGFFSFVYRTFFFCYTPGMDMGMELGGDGGAGEGVCNKQTSSLLLLLIALLGCYQQGYAICTEIGVFLLF